MSGHSKWHNIQKTKGAADAKRSATFTKIAKEIIVAVKQGGSGDPANNSRLATVVAKAKAANMPNDNIKRTIDKALGSGNTDNYESVTYEGYGPCGVAVIVEALTIIGDILDVAPQTAPIFLSIGMHCLGCPSSRGETVEEACAVHGIDVDKLLAVVNEEANKPIAE